MGAQTDVVVNIAWPFSASHQERYGNKKIKLILGPSSVFSTRKKRSLSGETCSKETLEDCSFLTLGLLSHFCCCTLLSLILRNTFSSSSLCCCSTCPLGQDVSWSLNDCSSSSLSRLCPHHRCLLLSRAGTRRKTCAVSSALCQGDTSSISGPTSTYGNLCFWQLWDISPAGCALLSVCCQLDQFDVSLIRNWWFITFWGVTGPVEREVFIPPLLEKFSPNVVG